jgi:serine phosphatase RsbU (regulator of sigma subunit)
MTGALLYLLGLTVVLVWYRWRPRMTLRATLLFWWSGLILARAIPSLAAFALRDLPRAATSPAVQIALDLLSFAGAILLLRSLLTLLIWQRPRRRYQWVLGFLFGLGLVLGAFEGTSIQWFVIPMAIPFMLWVRWRDGLSASGLTLAALTGLLSVVLCGITWSPGAPDPDRLTAGMALLKESVSRRILTYGLIATAPAAVRIHLSIHRIGRRLVVSHLLAGLVPGGLAAVFLLTSSALFLSTYRGEMGAGLLAESAREAKDQLGRSLSLPEDVRPLPFGDAVPRQTILTRRGGGPVTVAGTILPFAADSLLLSDVSSAQAPLLWGGGSLYLRARLDTLIGGAPLLIEALAPVDSLRMVRVSRLLGIPVRLSPRMNVTRHGGGVTIGEGDSTAVGSIGPPRPPGRALPGGTIVPCLARGRNGWVVRDIPLSSSASLLEPLRSLFSTARDNPLAIVVLLALGLIAFLFIGAIMTTLAMVVRMGRTIMESVGALTRATSALGEGKLDYRIPIEGKDELWRVAGSFNEMAEGLQRMREMELQTERMEEELRLARAIQNRLLPASAPVLEHWELAGRSLPAREVGGDYFDYLLLPDGRVGLTVADVSGKGAGAALLMSSFRASLRSQDLAQLGPAQTLSALNRFVCSSVDPGKFITAFLAILDPRTGEIRYANGGHEPPLILRDGATIGELAEGGLILGAFAQAEYTEGVARMPSGSLLAIFTDGVTEAQNVQGEFFGSERLLEVLAYRSPCDCPALLERVLVEIQSFAGGAPQSDDITLLLARKE